MPPVNTYTAQATTRDVRVSISAHKSLQQTDVALLPFGNGDGGGGAVAPMLESLRRIRAAADKSRDLPKVSMGQSVEDLFHHIIKTTNNGEDLVDWIGELYLEYHRGTYTSHGSIKNHNRRSEELMRDIELISTVAFLRSCQEEGSKPYRYPKDEIDALWEDVVRVSLQCQSAFRESATASVSVS
jgi:alpha-mannosidase